MRPMNNLVLRPCEVKTIGKALFHLWEQYSKPIPAGLTIGSYPAGIVSYTVGIVEDSNGQIHRVPPEEIKFLGDIMREYDFGEENNDLVFPFMLDGSYFVYSPQVFSKFAISIDYGTINPCSAGLWGLNGVCWYRIKEYYFDSRIEGYQRTDEEHLDEILKSLVGEKHITAYVVDPSAASFAEILKRHGFNVVIAENNLLKGIEQVKSALKDSCTIMICKNCKNAIREFNEYKIDSLTHKPIRENDHAMDDIRYFVSVMEELKYY